MTDTQNTTFRELAAKGDGVLVRRGNIWSYPGAPYDGSGTNLHLPVEYVTDAEVQAALNSGDLFAVTRAPDNMIMSVRVKTGDGEGKPVISAAQAGTADAGTELPPNSRPSHDAGMKRTTPREAEDAATRSIQSAFPHPSPLVARPIVPPVLPGVEGSESGRTGEASADSSRSTSPKKGR